MSSEADNKKNIPVAYNSITEDNNNQELAQNNESYDSYSSLEDYEDDQLFVKKEGQSNEMDAITEEIFQDIMNDLEEFQSKQSSVRPNTFQNRSLSHEHGGLEIKKHDGKSKEDEWDDRSEEVQEMAEEAYDFMTDASTSGIRKSFIHRKKQDKKREKKRKRDEEEVESSNSLSDMFKPKEGSHASKVKQARSESKGGGGMSLF